MDKILSDGKKQPALSAAAIWEKTLDIINVFTHAPKPRFLRGEYCDAIWVRHGWLLWVQAA